MGGGSPGSNKTEYEAARKGVDRRSYGQLSKSGIQSMEQFQQFSSLGKGKSQSDFQMRNPAYKDGFDNEGNGSLLGSQGREFIDDVAGYKSYQSSTGGASYDSKWGRWRMSNGVDMEAALNDWNNYVGERTEIAGAEAKDIRRQEAPDELDGTSGSVDYTLGIEEEDKKETSVGAVETVDTSPSTASTSQSLGIY